MLNTVGAVLYPSEGIQTALEQLEARARISRRYRMQDVAARLLPHRRALAGCGRWVAHGKDRVELCHYEAPARMLRCSRMDRPPLLAGKVKGLQSCSSPHICPVCAPKIAERRVKTDLEPGLAAARAMGLGVLTLTYKLRHKQGDNFRVMGKGFVDAREMFRSGGAWTRLRKKYGIVGTIRAFELTYGANGFHPHFHELMFFSTPLDVFQRLELIAEFKARWAWAVAQCGLREVTLEQGLDVSETHEAVERYIQKQLASGTLPADAKRPLWDLPQEMAKQPVKAGRSSYQNGEKVKGYSMFELLSIVTEGELVDGAPSPAQAAAIFQEYDSVVTELRIRQLYWSPGLKALLGVKELTDAQIEALDEQEVHKQVWGELRQAEWNCLAADGKRAEVVGVLTNGTISELTALIAPYRAVTDRAGLVKHRLLLDDPLADDRDRLPVVGAYRDPLLSRTDIWPDITPQFVEELRDMDYWGYPVCALEEERQLKREAFAEVSSARVKLPRRLHKAVHEMTAYPNLLAALLTEEEQDMIHEWKQTFKA